VPWVSKIFNPNRSSIRSADFAQRSYVIDKLIHRATGSSVAIVRIMYVVRSMRSRNKDGIMKKGIHNAERT